MSIARVSAREGGSEQKGSRHAPGPLSIEDAVAELVLDNGPQNRINDQLCADLVAGLERAQVDGARPILIHGAADHFSCGGDLVEWRDMELHEIRSMAERLMDGSNRLERVALPVVSAVGGLCFAGGFEMALRTDVSSPGAPPSSAIPSSPSASSPCWAGSTGSPPEPGERVRWSRR